VKVVEKIIEFIHKLMQLRLSVKLCQFKVDYINKAVFDIIRHGSYNREIHKGNVDLYSGDAG
jgi:hypothetical protein